MTKQQLNEYIVKRANEIVAEATRAEILLGWMEFKRLDGEFASFLAHLKTAGIDPACETELNELYKKFKTSIIDTLNSQPNWERYRNEKGLNESVNEEIAELEDKIKEQELIINDSQNWAGPGGSENRHNKIEYVKRLKIRLNDLKSASK